MKPAIVFFLLFFTAQSYFGQSLKKKYLGTYSGEIPAYAMDAGGVVVDVKAATMTVKIDGNIVTRIIGGEQDYGNYNVSSPEKDYYLIEMHYSDGNYIQQFLLYRKSKELIFKGIYPQPDAVLKKQ